MLIDQLTNSRFEKDQIELLKKISRMVGDNAFVEALLQVDGIRQIMRTIEEERW